MSDVLVHVLKYAAVAVSGLLCLAGIALSVLSISGTWVVLGVAALLGVALGRPFPGVGTFVVFLLLCIAVEVVEALAAAWGVRARGGSRLAGTMAVVGGFIGLGMGAFVPVPIIAPLLGMLLGSFLGAFLLESSRQRRHDHAAHVAWGTVLARVAVILVKVAVTVGMVAYLAIGLMLSS